MDLHCSHWSTSTRLQTQRLLLLLLPSSVWASWATWIPIKPFAAYKLEWTCFLEYSILQYSKLQPEDSVSYKVAFWRRKSAFAFPQTNVIMNNTLLTVENNAICTLLSCGPHTDYSIVLNVTGGSLKTTTLKPGLVNKQKIKRQNHTRLPSKSLKG